MFLEKSFSTAQETKLSRVRADCNGLAKQNDVKAKGYNDDVQFRPNVPWPLMIRAFRIREMDPPVPSMSPCSLQDASASLSSLDSSSEPSYSKRASGFAYVTSARPNISYATG